MTNTEKHGVSTTLAASNAVMSISLAIQELESLMVADTVLGKADPVDLASATSKLGDARKYIRKNILHEDVPEDVQVLSSPSDAPLQQDISGSEPHPATMSGGQNTEALEEIVPDRSIA